MNEDVDLRLTDAGRVVVVACGVLAAVVYLTGNNLLAMLLAFGLSLVSVSAPMVALNLRGLEVHRQLPHEVFQGRTSHGWWVLRNRRRLLAAREVEVTEAMADRGSRFPAAMAGGGSSRTAASWQFERRGLVSMQVLAISSSYPFGLWRAERHVHQPVDVIVYPRPLRGLGRQASAWQGEQEGHQTAPGSVGDFLGLREYQPGDRLASIHWGVSARRSGPVVVQRSGEVGRAVHISVAERPGEEAWEGALSRACGEVLDAFAQGLAVGLDLDGTSYPPEVGGAWRRRLLGILGTAPDGGAS